MPSRRDFIERLAGLPLLGGLFSPGSVLGAVTKRDFFKELGVRPCINAAGTYTSLTGSLMPPEVVAAWNYASHKYVRLSDLHDAVSQARGFYYPQRLFPPAECFKLPQDLLNADAFCSNRL